MTLLRRHGKTLSFLSLIVLTLALFLLVHHQEKKPETTEPSYLRLKEEQDIFPYAEAISIIYKNALFMKPGTKKREIVNDSLKAYLSSHDPYSDYLTKSEYHQYKQLQSESYIGIGLDLKKDHLGHYYCFPFPGSPAEKSGIHSGDRLIRINGTPVSGQSLPSLVAQMVGDAGTVVQLTVAANTYSEKQVSIIRQTLYVKNVLISWIHGLPVIKLSYFSQNTRNELRQEIAKIKKKPLILDLRGNPGGKLVAAISSAMLFLDKGEKIGSIATRTGEQIFSCNTDGMGVPLPIYIWQDETTASAAEMFIAALTENKKAVSIGRRTFGKGTQQNFLPLSDGSVLILTTGKMLTPTGMYFQKVGLEPTHKIQGENASTDDYLSETKKLIIQK